MKLLLSFLFFSFTASTFAQSTLIPDPNFEAFLINEGYDNGPINGYVPTANISGVTVLLMNGENISDLTGIQDFSALTILYCSDNLLTSIDLTQNTNLNNLFCTLNQLSSLDLTQNPNLQYLNCSSTTLTSLNLSQNVNLLELKCTNNPLTSLDLSMNPMLTLVSCSHTLLTTLDLTQNPNLQNLTSMNCDLTSIDVSQCPNLLVLNCNTNDLTFLDVGQNTNLQYLNCTSNDLTNLDISPNTNLTTFYCSFNDLVCLNIGDFIGPNESFEINPYLTCIESNNPVYANLNFSYDPWATFELNCPCDQVIDSISACNSYTWIDGITYYSSTNTPTWTLMNAAGADSIINLNLTINSNTGTDVITACDSIAWVDGITYFSTTNSPTWTLTNMLGCDSVVTLDLTVYNSTIGTDDIIACDSYTWIDGLTYSSSTNSPTWTLTNSVGCDSVITLDLTINYSNTGMEVITACDSYTWIDGITYTTSTNTPTWILSNTVGCDSVVTLDLTMNYSNTGIDVITACDSFTWIDGITYFSTTNSPSWTLMNAVGCDSIVTLDLTINYSNNLTDVITACDSYVWIDGNTYAASTNAPTWTYTNVSGCDSTIVLNLTINNSAIGSPQNVSACDSYLSPSGNYLWSSSGLYYDTVQTINGCDSILIINLTIETLDMTVLDISNTLVSMQSGATYQWMDCSTNTIISSETNQTFIPTSGGSYAVIVTYNNCTDTSQCLTNYLGIDLNEFENQIQLYPNPTNGDYIIEFGEVQSDIFLEVINNLGQVLKQEYYLQSDRVTSTLPYESGVYFIRISVGDKQILMPLIKK